MKTSQYAFTKVSEIRADFWREHSHLKAEPQSLDAKTAFMEYVLRLAVSGSISRKLAESATI